MGPETETELEQEVAAEEAAALELGELAPALELEQPRPKARPMTDFRLATILNQGGVHGRTRDESTRSHRGGAAHFNPKE